MKKLFKEFGDFIKRGNVIDLAVAVVVGGAFSSIVNSLVADVIMPVIGMITGGINISELKTTVGSAELAYGAFLQAVINFLIIAFVLFMIIKIINTASEKASKLKKKGAKEEEKPAPPVKPEEVVLLEQIRDLLKKNK